MPFTFFALPQKCFYALDGSLLFENSPIRHFLIRVWGEVSPYASMCSGLRPCAHTPLPPPPSDFCFTPIHPKPLHTSCAQPKLHFHSSPSANGRPTSRSQTSAPPSRAPRTPCTSASTSSNPSHAIVAPVPRTDSHAGKTHASNSLSPALTATSILNAIPSASASPNL